MSRVDELPRRFGPYSLLQLLARGGMGEVYLAKHGGIAGYEKHCVVKTLRDDLDNDGEYVSRFSEEARVVVQLSHRNICSVFDVGRAEGRLYLAMEHIIGRDLRLTISLTRLSTALAVHITNEVLEALDYAHRLQDSTTGGPMSIVHRDVSPHNVLLGVEGDVKLIDFGIATTVRQGPLTASGTVLGKLNYMAPEHARGEAVDGRADQYACAVMLVQLLTGQGFYDGLSREQAWTISGKGGHRPSGYAELDGELRNILDRALEPKRERRFTDCNEFGEALVHWARQHEHVADARDVRRLMRAHYGDIAAEAREVYRSHVAVTAPQTGDFGPASQWETIATTMMVGPQTNPPPSSPIADAPSTMIVRTPGAARDKTAPLGKSSAGSPSGKRALIGAALGLVAGVALGVVGVTSGLGARDDDAPRAPVAALPVESVPPAPPVAPAELDIEALDAPIEAIEPRSEPRRPSSGGSSSSSGPRPKPLGADTRANLRFLIDECVGKVPCAKNMIDWSKRRVNEAERAQLIEGIESCAKTCRLKM